MVQLARATVPHLWLCTHRHATAALRPVVPARIQSVTAGGVRLPRSVLCRKGTYIHALFAGPCHRPATCSVQ
jgi:hypothetical protein